MKMIYIVRIVQCYIQLLNVAFKLPLPVHSGQKHSCRTNELPPQVVTSLLHYLTWLTLAS